MNWNLIDPGRVPEIAAARDTYERSREAYLIALRELRLQVAIDYFTLQRQDEQVRIGQQSVRASIVSLRDARARFRRVWRPSWKSWRPSRSSPVISNS